jgi:hypothetical protein
MYDCLEAGKKKLYVESLKKRVEIGKSREITLTLHVPLGEFRVLIPHLSPKRRKPKMEFTICLEYSVADYYTGLPNKTRIFSSYSATEYFL